MDNVFLTVITIFNWNFQSIANSTVQPFVTEYLRKECGDLSEVASDNDGDKDDNDVANSKNVEVVKIGVKILKKVKQ